MTEILKTAALAVTVCVICAVIKQHRPEYAPIVQIAAVAVIAAYCVSVLIKALGVAGAAQITGDICRDKGNSAVAGASELAAKAAIIALALPLIRSAVGLAKELINI